MGANLVPEELLTRARGAPTKTNLSIDHCYPKWEEAGISFTDIYA